MSNINLEKIILFFIGMYFLIAFYPLRLDFMNSYIPGQLIPLFFIALFSLLSIQRVYIKSNNLDLRIMAALSLYLLFNTFIQGTLNQSLIGYRITSLIGSLIPMFFFYLFMFIDLNDTHIKVMRKYLFFGLVIYAIYYIESFLSYRFFGAINGNGSEMEKWDRVMGQRDAIYLNLALIVFLCKNYYSNYFLKFFGFSLAIGVLFILIYSQSRIGYLLLLMNILALSVIYRRYFFSIFLPLIALFIIIYVLYFRHIGDVYELMLDSDANQLLFSIARFNTFVNSIFSIFSDDFILYSSERVRFEIWNKILESVSQSPFTLLFGYGEIGVHALNESFLMHYLIDAANFTKNGYYPYIWEVETSESQLFDTLFRRGLIGVFFLFTIFIRFMYLTNQLMRIDKKFKDIYLGLNIYIISISVALIILPFMRDRAFSLFFFIAYAILSSRAYIMRSNNK